jgi:hypothetical protein
MIVDVRIFDVTINDRVKSQQPAVFVLVGA